MKKKKNSSDNNIWPSFVRVFGSLVASIEQTIIYSLAAEAYTVITKKNCSPVRRLMTHLLVNCLRPVAWLPVRAANKLSSILTIYSLNFSFYHTRSFGWLLHTNASNFIHQKLRTKYMFEPEPRKCRRKNNFLSSSSMTHSFNGMKIQNFYKNIFFISTEMLNQSIIHSRIRLWHSDNISSFNAQ